MLKAPPSMTRNPASFEASHSQYAQTRYMRPADLAQPRDRTPLRQEKEKEKSNRRESRLGLRNLFNRSKSSVGEYDRPRSPTRHVSPRKVSVRAVAAEIDSRSTDSPQIQEKSSLGSRLSIVVDRTASEKPSVRPELSANEISINATPRPARHARDTSDVTLLQPPLFKAYPQAIRNATLSAPTLPSDAILRLNENKRGFLHGTESLASADAYQESSRDGEKERPRRLQRHTASLSSSSATSKFEWTNRIYILSTSGCLLEYTGTGSFDRLPERVVRLSKTSAAYVSDAIPGRHYVLQISSGVEQDAAPTDDSRSLLSKFVPRGSERRNAANMLMTFNNVEEMNGWMVSLRREIERLGGQRPLSETGQPMRESEVYQSDEDQAQRLLVLKKHSPLAESFDWPSVQDGEGPDGTPLTVRDPSLDDGSTNSVVSQDGRQLESLRESGNRLSHASSGQRTMMSSGSSPMSSPTRDSFPSSCDEMPLNYEVRSRPNAAAILNRRTSMLTTAPFVEPAVPQIPLSHSAAPRGVPAILGPKPAQPPPNFSVPRSANRHFAPTASPPSTKQEQLSIHDRDMTRPPPRPRRPPPMSLHTARPLSMVIDQPSPQVENAVLPTAHALTRPHTSRGNEGASSTYRSSSMTRPALPAAADGWQRGSSNRLSSQPVLRRMSSMNSMHKAGGGAYSARASFVPSTKNQQATRALQRASMITLAPNSPLRPDSMEVPLMTSNGLPPLLAPPPSVPLPPLPVATKRARASSASDAIGKGLMYRRSMPQLAHGPPAPPPMSALPPLPLKASVQMGAFI